MQHKGGRLPDTILIANRGEIAVRIARTCRELGIRSIGVYSEADTKSIHVSACDTAVCLSGLPPRQAYLDGDRIIAVAKEHGAEAIHPGYGFLSENARFAEACQAAGITFIGPAPDIIARMGDKIAAKAFAAAAGIPVVPGIADDPAATEAHDRDARLFEAAAALTFPVLVKASAGGGGRGMRIVKDREGLPEAIGLARREAQSAFGSDRLLIERYISSPRHVEVQIFGDRHGNVVHLLERDCSVQRRHQKLIEEAPAPALEETTREALHEAASALARAANYDNAGTVEFVVDAQTQEFFFLEVNTRLQVEHPVTEAILGLDLVAWQIRVAAGQPLPCRQDDIHPDGWAVEARITAEDALAGFMPQTGTLVRLVPPAGPGIRFDAGVSEGSAVTPNYDSMLAKVIAHGPDREVAIRRLWQALNGMTALGVTTNIAFVQDVLVNPAFEAGRHTTHLIEEMVRDVPAADAPQEVDRAAHAAAAVLLMEKERAARSISPWSSIGSWRAGGPSAWAPRGGLVLEDDEDGTHWYWIRLRGPQVELEDMDTEAPKTSVFVVIQSHDRLAVEAGGQRWVYAGHVGDDRTVYLEGSTGARTLRNPTGLAAWRQAHDAAADGDSVVRATGPGLVVSIAVAPGDTVEAGAALLVIESMKMLTTVTAPRSGTVANVACNPGQSIAKGDLLVELSAPAEEDK